MTNKPPRGTFAATYDDLKRSVGKAGLKVARKRRRGLKTWEASIEKLTVDAFDYGVRWALQREWTEHQKRYVLGE